MRIESTNNLNSHPERNLGAVQKTKIAISQFLQADTFGMTNPLQYKYNLATDTVSFSGSKRLEKKKAKQEEAKQIAEGQFNPEEKSVLSRLKKTDILITKANSFLTGINEKPHYKLNQKEKSRLEETEKFLTEKEAYLQNLSEKVKDENERKKLEAVTANLNRVSQILEARTAMNAQAQQKKPVFYIDTPSKTKKEPAQKPESPVKAEIEKLNQIRGSKNLARQRDLLSKQIGGINEKLNNITEFLIGIEKKPDNVLNKKEKNELSQVKPILAKKENQLEKIEEQNQKEIKTQKTREKIAQINQALEARANIQLSEYKPHEDYASASVDLEYKNAINLKSTPNYSYKIFQDELDKKIPGIINEEKAAKRVSSLSIYLKEKMVGFKVPEYELNEEKKGGYQWFERGLENLIIGSKKENLKPEEYKDTAKELFGILSVHDNYWKSPDFSNYLYSLKTSPTINENQIKAVDATIQAIKELNEPAKIGFGAQEIISMRARAFSPMKFMPEVYENCAYTGKNLSRESKEDEFRPSADHIIPHCWKSSQNDDGNFVIASSKSNSDRGNMPLLKYLKGYTAF